MTQRTLFDADAPEVHAVCPTCKGERFMPITGGSGRLRCLRCGWLIVIAADGRQRDALDWTGAGRKRGQR